jgi:hypothetical protein
MIEMSRKILILKTFVPKMIFFNPSLKKTEVEHLQKWKKNIGFNNVIGLNQKILILNRFATDKMIL